MRQITSVHHTPCVFLPFFLADIFPDICLRIITIFSFSQGPLHIFQQLPTSDIRTSADICQNDICTSADIYSKIFAHLLIFGKSYQIFPKLGKRYQKLPKITKCYQMLPNVTKSCNKLPKDNWQSKNSTNELNSHPDTLKGGLLSPKFL